jgi:hypothetical protein
MNTRLLYPLGRFAAPIICTILAGVAPARICYEIGITGNG